MATPKKRTADDASLDEEDDTSMVTAPKRKSNRIPIETLREDAYSKIQQRYQVPKEAAVSMFKTLETRLDAVLIAGDLRGARSTEEKESLKAALATFDQEPANDLILKLFTNDPTREKVLQSVSASLRRNMRKRSKRQTQSMPGSQPAVTPPAGSPEAGSPDPPAPVTSIVTPVGLRSPIIATAEQPSQPNLPGQDLQIATILRCYSLDDTKEPIYRTDLQELMRENPQGTTTTVANLKFVRFIKGFQRKCSFDITQHSLFGISTSTTASKDTGMEPIMDAKDWQEYIRLESRTATEVLFGFTRAKTGIALNYLPLVNTADDLQKLRSAKPARSSVHIKNAPE